MTTPHTPDPQPNAQPQQPAQQAQQAQQAHAQSQQPTYQQQVPQQNAYAQQPQQYAQARTQQQQQQQQQVRPGQQTQPGQPARQQQQQQLPSQVTTLGGTNTFALLAIFFAFLSPIAGIIFGHMGLSQIKRTGDAGRGIGLTGLIISYASFVIVALFVFAYAFMILALIGTMGAAFNDYTLS